MYQSVAGQLSLRVMQLDVDCETKTKDDVFVTIVVSVQYQVVLDDVYEAYYKLTNPEAQIRSYVYDGEEPSLTSPLHTSRQFTHYPCVRCTCVGSQCLFLPYHHNSGASISAKDQLGWCIHPERGNCTGCQRQPHEGDISTRLIIHSGIHRNIEYTAQAFAFQEFTL